MTTRTQTTAALAAKEIRTELKASFPGIKFSVTSETYAGGNSVNVGWTDGPTRDAVEEITNKYEYGHFDGMTDMYEYSNRDSEVAYQVKYTFANRSMSDETREALNEFVASDVSDYDKDNAKYRVFVKLDLRGVTVSEAISEKETEEELARKAYLVEQEESKRRAAEQQKAMEARIEKLADVKVVALGEEEQYRIADVNLVRKAGNMKTMLEDLKEGQADCTPVKVTHEITLTEEQMNAFTEDFFMNLPWLAGQGGSDSDYNPGREINNFWEMTTEETELWRAKGYCLVIRVRSDSRDLLVDPQGHDYARYVALTPELDEKGCEEPTTLEEMKEMDELVLERELSEKQPKSKSQKPASPEMFAGLNLGENAAAWAMIVNRGMHLKSV